MNSTNLKGPTITFLVYCLMWQLLSCASVDEFVQSTFRKPEVSFSGAKITDLSFQRVDLLFDLNINNPNALGIKMDGFDYDFHLNGNSFVKGEQTDGLEIASEAQSTVRIPVSLAFADIYQTFSDLKGQDSTRYNIACGFSFDLPVLGKQRIPVSKQGSLPMLKLPSVSIHSLKLDNLSFTGADLTLKLDIENPNAFSFDLNKIDYTFQVNGQPWLQGISNKVGAVGAKGGSTLALPISLNILQIGQSVRKVLTSDEPLSYELAGDLGIATSLPFLGDVALPFAKNGSVSISR